MLQSLSSMALQVVLTSKVSLTAGEYGAAIRMRSSVSRILRSLLALPERSRLRQERVKGRLRAQLGRSLALVRCSPDPGHEANRSVRARKVPDADSLLYVLHRWPQADC